MGAYISWEHNYHGSIIIMGTYNYHGVKMIMVSIIPARGAVSVHCSVVSAYMLGL